MQRSISEPIIKTETRGRSEKVRACLSCPAVQLTQMLVIVYEMAKKHQQRAVKHHEADVRHQRGLP